MGNDMVHDPDDTYELTTDNVKKILAIYMRFRYEVRYILSKLCYAYQSLNQSP